MRRTLAALLLALSIFDVSALSFNVTFDDPQRLFWPYYDLIKQDVDLASEDWGLRMSREATIDLLVSFEQIPTAAAASTTASLSHRAGGFDVYHQGAGARLIGVSPPATYVEAVLQIGTDYLQRDMHFTGQGTLPANRTHARSVFTHELGHMLGFNGWRHPTDGTLPGSYMSTFDALTRFDGSNFWFTGENAVAQYGAEVPLTFGNIFHLGNRAPRPGQDLIADVLNGVQFQRGLVYQISTLDVAIMCDLDLPMRNCLGRGETATPIVVIDKESAAIPEPATLPLLAVAAAWAVWLLRKPAFTSA